MPADNYSTPSSHPSAPLQDHAPPSPPSTSADSSLGLPTTPNLIPGGDSLFIDGRKLAAGETFCEVLDARTRVLENLGWHK